MPDNMTLAPGKVPEAIINQIEALEAEIASLKAQDATLAAAGIGKWNGKRRSIANKIYHATDRLAVVKSNAVPPLPPLVFPGNPCMHHRGEWEFDEVNALSRIKEHPLVVKTLYCERGDGRDNHIVGLNAKGEIIAWS